MLIDWVTLNNTGEVFAYSGGRDGMFLRQQGRWVMWGTYEDAGLQVTDGAFTECFAELFSDAEVAKQYVIDLAGSDAKLDLSGEGLGWRGAVSEARDSVFFRWDCVCGSLVKLPEDEQRRIAFDKGSQARVKGFPITSNPFQRPLSLRASWLAGWADAAANF